MAESLYYLGAPKSRVEVMVLAEDSPVRDETVIQFNAGCQCRLPRSFGREREFACARTPEDPLGNLAGSFSSHLLCDDISKRLNVTHHLLQLVFYGRRCGKG